MRQTMALALIFLFSANIVAAQSVSLNGQALVNDSMHDESGALIVTAYYTEYLSLGNNFPDYSHGPEIIIRNWYGSKVTSFQDVKLAILAADKNGDQIWYNTSWDVLDIDSGRLIGLVIDELAADKRRVSLIAISYQSREGRGIITDAWQLPTGSANDPNLTRMHLLARIPEIAADGNLKYSLQDRGEIKGYYSVV